MNELEILKWAAGANMNLPAADVTPGDVAEDRLLDLITQHRVSGRFLRRIRQERPRWCGRNLLFSAWKQQEWVTKNFQQQAAAVREITRALAARRQSLILVKGFSTYALTGEREHLRFSGDVDLFGEDPEVLFQTLLNLGYSGKRISEFEHEFASMSRAGVTVEIHKYLPVLAYPEGVLSADCDPARHPGRWIQRFATSFTRTEIRYEDLLPTATPGRTPDTSDLLFPDPSLCALILAANEFRDYLLPPYKAPLPIKLAVLCEIHALTRPPRFDRKRFADLVERFRARDCASLLGDLLLRVFGDDPLSPAKGANSEEKHPPRFPRALSYFGGWAQFGAGEEILRPLTMAGMNETLQANPVAATRSGQARRWYAVSAPGQGESVERVVFQSRGQEPIPFRFAATSDERALCLEIQMREPPQENVQYYADLRGDGIEWNATQMGAWNEEQGNSTVTMEESGCRFQVTFPWQAFSPAFRAIAAKPLILVVTRFGKHGSPYENADPVVVAPLSLLCE